MVTRTAHKCACPERGQNEQAYLWYHVQLLSLLLDMDLKAVLLCHLGSDINARFFQHLQYCNVNPRVSVPEPG